jgi:hypothetical protein
VSGRHLTLGIGYLLLIASCSSSSTNDNPSTGGTTGSGGSAGGGAVCNQSDCQLRVECCRLNEPGGIQKIVDLLKNHGACESPCNGPGEPCASICNTANVLVGACLQCLVAAIDVPAAVAECDQDAECKALNQCMGAVCG